ncbi:ricin-type beta-trefoil lectin domain protein [Kitasatospora sp. NPDC002040]|uniref:ricin-type beta-trefoil lectin domain protein n=1 Tax=Kitasatospora sp. NPDC002040 TaxID=3154661 RepID=UPI00331C3863
MAVAAAPAKEVPLPTLPKVSGQVAGGRSALPAPPRPAGARELKSYTPTAVKWPGKATTTVQLGAPAAKSGAGAKAEPVRAGNTPVLVGTAAPGQVGKQAKAAAGGAEPTGAPASVEVKVADRAQAQQAGVDGLLVALARADGAKDSASVEVSLDYGAIAAAYGGGWASRLQLVAMPSCALTTPELAECRTRRPLESRVDPATQRISGTLALPAAGKGILPESAAGSADAPAGTKLNALQAPASAGGGIAVGAEAAASGSQGSYEATDLSASGSWTQSSSGAFTYNHSITVPPALTGTGPDVGLSYSSQSVDGSTSARNSQASWIGDGWSYSPGYVERSYRSCRNSGIDKSGDQCWTGWNATVSLGGRSGELIRDSNGLYHLAKDDGTKVERLTGASNGLWQGEYFKVTTPDGTAYYFGLNHAPGTTSDAATNSAWGVPVYHPNSGDPCYSASNGTASQCDAQPGWRFNLDFSVDVHGNLTRYDWANETNYYARGGGQAAAGSSGTLTPYTRGGTLSRISYGYRLADALAGREPSARIGFDVRERCVVSDTVCTAQNLSSSTASNWPDVPYDLGCQSGWATSGSGSNVCRATSPSFWSTKRLGRITTEIRTVGGWQSVDRYDLTHAFSDAGGIFDPVTGQTQNPTSVGSLQSVLWLAEIRHTGVDNSTGGNAIALDPVVFTGAEVDNRVDTPSSGSGTPPSPEATPLYRPRIIGVRTEHGSSIAVTYRDAECSRKNNTMPTSADNNTMACFPVWWSTPGAAAPFQDWFNKSVLAKVTVSDATKANSPARTTSYSYSGPAWHRDDSDRTDDQYRTWNDFRGFRTVTTTSGAAPDPLHESVTTYLQGMDGDYKKERGDRRSVTVNNSLGEGTVDSDWLAGTALETATRTQAGGTVVTKQLAGASVFTPGATRARTAWTSKKPAPAPSELSVLPALEARRLKSGSERGLALLPDGVTWRTGRTTRTYDDLGRPEKVLTQPDLADPTTDSCATSYYLTPPAGNPMLLNYPNRTVTVAGSCTTAQSATTTISDQRKIYDGSADPNNPGSFGTFGQNGTTLGIVTATQALKSYDAQGQPVYQTLNAQGVDAYGRVVRSVDATGAVNLTSFTPSSDVLPTEVGTTGPLGWTGKTTLLPSRALATRVVDANGRINESTYDALGRRLAWWGPGRSKSAGKTAERTYEYGLHGAGTNPDPATVTTRTLRENETYNLSITVFDGFLKARQTQAYPANGDSGRVVTSTQYDSHGQVSKSIPLWSDPTTGPSTALFLETDNTLPSATRTVYDGLGRPTASKFYAKATELWQTVTSYPGAGRVDTTPPSGGSPTTVLTDALGRTTSSTVHAGAGIGDSTTRYAYDRRGLHSQMTDSVGNSWKYEYDLRGNRVSQTDPDTGTSTTAYDDFGRVTSTTDGRGASLSMTYDLTGRMTGRYEGTNTGDQSKLLASFTYDTLAKGYPTSSTRYVGGAGGSAYVQQIDGYTTTYQPTGNTTRIPAAETGLAGDYSRTNHYTDNIALPAGVSYNADGGLPTEKYGYTRNVQGGVVGTGSNSVRMLDLANYNPLGQLLRSTYGTAGQLMRTAQTWDDATGRLTTNRVSLQESAANPVSATTYGYDQVGNITTTSELQSSGGTDQTFDTQCFRYDGLKRLTEAWTDTWGTTTPGAGQVARCNNTTVTIDALGGPAPYWQSFQYNQLGDRTEQVRRNISGDTSRDVTQTSSYPGNGRTPAAKPNTVQSVTTRAGVPTSTLKSDVAGAGGSTICLDVKSSRSADGTPVQSYTCNGSGAQRWTRPGDGTLRALGKCLQPAGPAGLGTAVELGTCNGSDAQKWGTPDGALFHSSSTYCLDLPNSNQTPGTLVVLWYCNGGPNQKWPATTNAITGPSYTSTLTPQYDAAGSTTTRATATTGNLTSGLATGGVPLCLDINASGTANGTVVQSWTCNGSNAQDLTLGTDGTVRALGSCIRPVNGQGTSGTQIELWACDGSSSQRWRTTEQGALVHSSGLCIDIPWNSTSSGTRVALWTCNQGANQKWGSGGNQPTSGTTQSFTYDAEGRTATVTTGTAISKYLYDANGDLLIQRSPEGTVLHLFGGAEQITRSADGTSITANRYYEQPDGTTVVRSNTGSISYQPANPQKTSTLQIDAATRAVTRRSYDPYGALRGPASGNWAGNHGFLGKPVETSSGLNLLGARNYDAVLGRFLTADPLLVPGDPNQMGGYAYANNNPIAFSDASGLIAVDSETGTTAGNAQQLQQSVNKVRSNPDYRDWPGRTCSSLCRTLGYDSDDAPGLLAAINYRWEDHLVPDTGRSDFYIEQNQKVADKLLPKYDYTYEEYVGSATLGTPEQVMAYFKAHPQEIFPFPVEGCSEFKEGAECLLHAAGGAAKQFAGDVARLASGAATGGIAEGIAEGIVGTIGGPLGGDGTVSVSVTPTSFKFTVIKDGYFDKPGSTVEFSVSSRDNSLYLKQTAQTTGSLLPAWFSVEALDFARKEWNQQASNLSNVLQSPGYTAFRDGSSG